MDTRHAAFQLTWILAVAPILRAQPSVSPKEGNPLKISVPASLGQASAETLSLAPLETHIQAPQTLMPADSLSAPAPQTAALTVQAPFETQALAPTQTYGPRDSKSKNSRSWRVHRIARAAAAPLQILGRTLSGLSGKNHEQNSKIFFDISGRQSDKTGIATPASSSRFRLNSLNRASRLATPVAAVSIPFLHPASVRANWHTTSLAGGTIFQQLQSNSEILCVILAGLLGTTILAVLAFNLAMMFLDLFLGEPRDSTIRGALDRTTLYTSAGILVGGLVGGLGVWLLENVFSFRLLIPLAFLTASVVASTLTFTIIGFDSNYFPADKDIGQTPPINPPEHEESNQDDGNPYRSPRT